MQGISSLFAEETIFLIADEKTYEEKEILEFIGSKLIKLGYVKETFTAALIAREAEYPTGLKMEPFPVAIPHTDPEHVKKPCVCIVRLKNGVEFHEMMNTIETVRVNYIFCIVLASPDKQTGVLQNIISITSNKNLMDRIGKADTPKDILKIINDSAEG
jgi:Phosphotransferase system mannitol/fructose-specific IIA domain (Ntr-type)